MDIENMHPFCLPFGLCHDATSSATDFVTPMQESAQNRGSNESYSNNNNNSSSITDDSNETGTHKANQQIRSKTSSPTDELFKHLNDTCTTSLADSHSLLVNDDLIIGSSSLADIGRGDDVAFYNPLAGLVDIEMDTSGDNEVRLFSNYGTSASSKSTSDKDEDDDDDDDDKEDDDVNLVEDEWLCGQYSMFTPAIPANRRRTKRSLIREALLNGMNSNQVFQQLLDPISLKSSPTLAQLNLNSSDDPNDSLWGDAPSSHQATNSTSQSTCISSSITHGLSSHPHHHHFHNHHHISSTAGSTSSGCSTTGSALGQSHHCIHHTCHATSNIKDDHHCSTVNSNHNSNNHHHHHHHHHHATNNYNHHSSSSNTPMSTSLSACHPHHDQLHHHHDHNCNQKSSTQSTCLAVTPFRKALPCQQEYSACCHCSRHDPLALANSSLTLGANSNNNNSNSNNNNSSSSSHQSINLKACSPLNQSADNRNNVNPPTGYHQLHNRTNNNNNNTTQQRDIINCAQQRSASPALVTSSSSPMSSTTVAGPATGALSAPVGDANNRLIDNKLKENIDYLTALLCNGSTSKLGEATSPLPHPQQMHQRQLPQPQPIQAPPQHQLQQQQPPPPSTPNISSTMARSYSTLAMSLSRGPKLLEQRVPMQLQHQQLHHALQQHQPPQSPSCDPNRLPNDIALPKTANEVASSCIDGLHHNAPAHMPPMGASAGKTAPNWICKPSIESSVSAADSTDSQITSLSSIGHQQQHLSQLHHHHHNHNHHHHNHPHQQQHHLHPACQHPGQLMAPFNGKQQLVHEQRQQSVASQEVAGALQEPAPMSCSEQSASDYGGHSCSGGWQMTAGSLVCSTSVGKQQQQSQQQQVPTTPANEPTPLHETPIPPNGRPITLTPLLSQNNPIINAAAAAAPGKPKTGPPSLFAQPASPSASSTASSGANTDVGSSSSAGSTSSSSSSPLKRQRNCGTAAALAIPANGDPANHNNGANNHNHLQSKGGSSRSGRPNSLSTDCSLSSHDEGFSSQIDNDDCGSARDSDDDDDVDSDDESFYGEYTNSDLIGASISDNAENKWTLNMGRTRRNGQKRYFWQYNVQSKGPKGTRICSTDDSEDPFVLPEAADPVFSNDCQIEGVKHSGKARRGDGNDLTPNPRKLLMIGLELKKLGKIINELAPVTDLPINARNKTRKEKNKLASRACRLKKKAQHEANKIKLYGLQKEHQQVVLAIFEIRKLLDKAIADKEAGKQPSQQHQQMTSTSSEVADKSHPTIPNADVNMIVSPTAKTIVEQCTMRVAGSTSDYVNSILEKVVSGCIDGGLT